MGEGLELLKILGVVRYLEGMLSKKTHPDDRFEENDIVSIADAFDLWFQLPPEVLLSRYHNINRRANKRLYK